MSGKRRKMEEGGPELEKCSSYTFATRYTANEIPKYYLPEEGEPAQVAKQLIDDERMLDRNPRMNLASFVTTWMEEEVGELIKNSLNVNFVDSAQYPSCLEIQNRCVAMLADLFHAEGKGEEACGTACIGSSEAIMLCGLNLKMRWKQKMKAKGKPTMKPNLIMGANVQVCWEKFCRYFEVEERYVFLKEGQYALTPEDVAPLVDENTIGCVAILGSTYDGQLEDCLGVSNALDKVEKETGLDVPIHVDGASGAFVAPFLFPDLVWDFQVPRVLSINASGHKYGLVYPGLGWAIWKDKQSLHEDMVFHTNYLGSDQPSITLNFSKGAAAIIAQYYQFIRLGRSGYRKIMQNLAKVAKHLETSLVETGHFKILNKPLGVPLVAFSLTDHPSGRKRNYDEFNLADKLKETGWVLPAYTMAPNAGHVKLLRAVIREDMSYALCEKLVEDVLRAIDYLDHLQHELPSSNQVFLHKGPC